MGKRGGHSRGKFKRRTSVKNRKQHPRNENNSGKKQGLSKRDSDSEISHKKAKLEPKHSENDVVAHQSESDEESEEEVHPYIQLLTLFKGGDNSALSTDDENEHQSQVDGDDNSEEEDVNDDGEEEDSDDDSERNDYESLSVQDVDELCEKSDSDSGEDVRDQSDTEDDEEDENIESDPLMIHFEPELSEPLLETLTSSQPYALQELKWKALGQLMVYTPKVENSKSKSNSKLLLHSENTYATPGKLPVLKIKCPLRSLNVKSQICANLASGSLENPTVEQVFSPLQQELFSLIRDYKDVYYPERNYKNGDEIRTVYCVHAINHVLKTRNKILQHNNKLRKAAEAGQVEEFRDQGLVRPRVLILVPFRDSALKIVKLMASILLPEKGQILNRKRFFDEYGSEDSNDAKKTDGDAKKRYKPEDFEATFTGNIDDNFRIGLAVSKRSLKLYTGFYMSDILIASPIGLRMLLDEEFDFLSSIEVLIMDQTDVLYMQNWDHVIHIFQHLHLQPREQHGTDMNRIRLWALNGWASHYRQTLIFSSVPLPEAVALFMRKGTNFSGKVRVENPVSPNAASVCHIVVQLPQAFHRFETSSAVQAADDRFQFFVKKVLPQYRDALMSNTLIYVPSYYDYVRLRNYFRKEDVNYAQACEYTPEGKLAEARNRFFLGKRRLLLYTERLHYFRRLTIKGIHHLIFYQLPTFPHFYAEICNLLQDAFQNKKYRGDNSQTCTVIYCSFDAPRLCGIAGNQRAAQMIKSDRSVHLFVSGQRT